MERINQQVLDAIVELTDVEFSERFVDIATNFKTNTSNDAICKFLKEVQTFCSNKLERSNPNLKNNPIYLNYIFKSFLSHQTKDQHKLCKTILISIYEKWILICNIHDLSILLKDDVKLSQTLNELSKKMIKAEVIEALEVYYIKLFGENISYLNEINVLQMIKEFSNVAKQSIHEAYHLVVDEEYKQICIIDTICSFENIAALSTPSSFCKSFHQDIWLGVVIPFKFKKYVTLHSKRIDELILKKGVEENLIEKYGDQLLRFKNGIMTQIEFKKLDKFFENLSHLVDIELKDKFKYDIQKSLFKNSIMFHLYSLLSGATSNVQLSSIFRHFGSADIDSEEKVVIEIASRLNEAYKRNFESILKNIDIEFKAETVQELSKMIIQSINETFDEHLYMCDDIDNYRDNFVALIFKNIYKMHYKSIPRPFHFHILQITANLLGCHESKIDPIEDLNGQYIVDMIVFKVQPLIIQFKNSYHILLQERMKISTTNNLLDIDRISKIIEGIQADNYNLFNKILDEIKNNISTEVCYYFDDEHSRSIVSACSALAIKNELFELFEGIFKNAFYDYLKGNKMNLTNDMIKTIQEKLEKVKTGIQETINYSEKISTLELNINESSLPQSNPLFAQEVVVNNFFNDLKAINESIDLRIPHIPYLIDELTAAQYIVLAYILEINLQGQLVDLSDKKIIEDIASISQKSAYDTYNKLIEKELLVIIDDKKSIAIANAPKMLEIAKEYYKKKLTS